jgi:hypothetical protein
MIGFTVLLDKLAVIERSLGVESDSTIRGLIIDAQDCALQMQGEIADVLLGDSQPNVGPTSNDSGWRRALAAVLPTSYLSSLWKR